MFSLVTLTSSQGHSLVYEISFEQVGEFLPNLLRYII